MYEIGRPKLLDAEEKFVGRPNYELDQTWRGNLMVEEVMLSKR